MYVPIQEQRYFIFNKKYSEIDWTDFQSVVKAFKQQIEYWYILPCIEIDKKPEGVHYAFALAALTCLLIDCLSQFESGHSDSERTEFKNYLVRHWPELGTNFTTAIEVERKYSSHPLRNGAEIIYHGLRCGILHEAHTKLYCGLAGCDGNIFQYHHKGSTKYTDGRDCPTVVIDASCLFHKIHDRFNEYCDELLDMDSSYDDLRIKFKQKFKSSYGIDL